MTLFADVEVQPLAPPHARRELVQWMEPGHTRLEGAGVAAVALIGVAVGLGALAAARWIAPRREGLPPWRWRRGPLH